VHGSVRSGLKRGRKMLRCAQEINRCDNARCHRLWTGNWPLFMAADLWGAQRVCRRSTPAAVQVRKAPTRHLNGRNDT